MVYLNNNVVNNDLGVCTLNYSISEDHMARWIKDFVLDNFKYLDDNYEQKKGRPAFTKTSLLAFEIVC